MCRYVIFRESWVQLGGKYFGRQGRRQDPPQRRPRYLPVRLVGHQQGISTNNEVTAILTASFFQTDLAQYVNASLEVMDRDAKLMRGDGPTIFCSVKEGKGIDDIVQQILCAWRSAGSPGEPWAGPSADE